MFARRHTSCGVVGLWKLYPGHGLFLCRDGYIPNVTLSDRSLGREGKGGLALHCKDILFFVLVFTVSCSFIRVGGVGRNYEKREYQGLKTSLFIFLSCFFFCTGVLSIRKKRTLSLKIKKSLSGFLCKRHHHSPKSRFVDMEKGPVQSSSRGKHRSPLFYPFLAEMCV